MIAFGVTLKELPAKAASAITLVLYARHTARHEALRFRPFAVSFEHHISVGVSALYRYAASNCQLLAFLEGLICRKTGRGKGKETNQSDHSYRFHLLPPKLIWATCVPKSGHWGSKSATTVVKCPNRKMSPNEANLSYRLSASVHGSHQQISTL